ncbi:MAG: hypothetical protein OEY20_01505 [Gemmatimonadota bacterium]|nr:hypothetical protein [Gemmatimonadota bacterium]MDH4350530.1 hypothetical protein [Gemmatimonadota bacterium]MDH5195908.1 hypothetical protein [Gemmatimonadota bacterium]
MRCRAFVSGAVLLLLACTRTGGGEAPNPRAGMTAALAALDRGDVETAAADLERVLSSGAKGTDVQHATLLGAVLYLHPRNPKRNPDRAAELAARYVTDPDAGLGETELGMALFELALDMGGNPRPEAVGGPLPKLPGGVRSNAERIRQLEAQIQRLQQELARIRQTLKPQP